MERILPLLLVVLLAACSGGSSCVSVVGACGGGIDPDTLARAEAMLCAGVDLEDVVGIYGGIVALLESLGGAPLPNVTFDDATGDYAMTLPLGTVTGVVASPDDPSDGLGTGEEATATWELNGGLAGAAATGEGSFTVVRTSPGIFMVTGSASTLHGTCSFEMTALNLTGSSASNLGAGTLVFSGTSSGRTMTGTMTFDSSDTARVEALFQGEAMAFYVDLDTYFVHE